MQDSSSEEYPLTVGSELANNVDSQKLYAKMLIKGHNVHFLLDSGATVNVLPESVYRIVCEDPELNGLEVPQGTKLSPLGRKRISVRNPQNNKKYRFQKFRLLVRKTNQCLLLGATAIQGMHLITVNALNILTAERSSDKGITLTHVGRSNTKMFLRENVLLEDKLHLYVDGNVTPVQMRVPKPPIALKEKYKMELESSFGTNRMDFFNSGGIATQWQVTCVS